MQPHHEKFLDITCSSNNHHNKHHNLISLDRVYEIIKMFTPKSCLLLAALTLLKSTTAHSWIEQMAVIGLNGDYVGPYGYPRGYVARTDPGFNGDSDKYILPAGSSGRLRIDSTDLLCHPSQRTPNQPAKWPRLKIAPGSAIAMKYLENGHVTLPFNQPGKPAPSRGTVYVFGTTEPSPTEKLTNVLAWTKDGSGGDKRGRLLGANNFDDLRCHQINTGVLSAQRQAAFSDPIPSQSGTHSENWCETDIVFPQDIQVGKTLTIYWVWDWPTGPGTVGVPQGKDEYYTTCADLDVVAQEPTGSISNVLGQQDPNTRAVTNYASRTAQAPLPRGQKAVSAPAAAAPAPAPFASSAPAPAASQATAPAASQPAAPAPIPVTMATSVRPASSAAASAGLVAVHTMLAPGQGLLMGMDGKIFTYNLPTDGGVVAPSKAKRGIVMEDAAMEVGGSHRFRMPKGGAR